jgi:hypothetical protein
MKECVQDANTIVITTPWKEFSKLPHLLNVRQRPVVIDCWRILKPLELTATGDYIQLGIGKDDHELE